MLKSNMIATCIAISCVCTGCIFGSGGDPIDPGVMQDMPEPTDMGGAGDVTEQPDVGVTDDGSTPPDFATGEDVGSGDDAGSVTPTLDGFVVFNDELAPDITFVDFADALNVWGTTVNERFSGSASLAFEVPASGFRGLTFKVDSPQDLSQYDALVFQVKASRATTLNTVGFGHEGATARQAVELRDLTVGSDWKRVVVPIPDPSLLTDGLGVFHFADAAGPAGTGYTLYFDEVRFVSLSPGDAASKVGSFEFETGALRVGLSATPSAQMTVEVLGSSRQFTISPFYLEWDSSNVSVATVGEHGLVTAIGPGVAIISAKLAGIEAGTWSFEVFAPPSMPAPPPAIDVADVDATIYSDAFTQVTVDTYDAPFGTGTGDEIQLGADNVYLYRGLGFVAIEFVGPNSLNLLDATTLHIDVWTPNATQFGIKLVDFGANNAFDNLTGDDSEGRFDVSPPADFQTGSWNRLEIPLDEFRDAGLTARENVSQIIIDAPTGSGTILFVDNIIFY